MQRLQHFYVFVKTDLQTVLHFARLDWDPGVGGVGVGGVGVGWCWCRVVLVWVVLVWGSVGWCWCGWCRVLWGDVGVVGWCGVV